MEDYGRRKLWGDRESFSEFSFECNRCETGACKMPRWSCEQAVGCVFRISCQATGVLHVTSNAHA